MTPEMSPEERTKWIEDRRQYVVQTATTAPDRPVPFLFAVHEVWKWLFAMPELKARVADADFQFLYGIVRECYGLPLSTERQYWARESLQEKDLKAESIEQRIREDVRSAFARIVRDLKDVP